MTKNTEIQDTLAAARERGTRALAGATLPAGLDQVAVYVGLISSALDLAKLIQTEERDLQTIGTHHEREVAKITAAFREVERGMLSDFDHNSALRAQTFEIIEKLIAAGQHEIALKFYERMIDGFKQGAMEGLIELRNKGAESSKTELKLK